VINDAVIAEDKYYLSGENFIGLCTINSANRACEKPEMLAKQILFSGS